LEEVELWSFVEGKATVPTDCVQLAKHNKKVAKAMRIILDFVKDHLIPHNVEKKLTKDMHDALITLH
jgi:uncharacterized protein (UPF0147 family)